MIFYMSIAWSYTERQVDIDAYNSGKQLLQETGDWHNSRNTVGVRHRISTKKILKKMSLDFKNLAYGIY